MSHKVDIWKHEYVFDDMFKLIGFHRFFNFSQLNTLFFFFYRCLSFGLNKSAGSEWLSGV